MTNLIIDKHEARALLFWASVGFQNSIGGSYQDIPEICKGIAKHFSIPFSKRDFQKGTKLPFWLTPKVASILWEVSVGRGGKIPSSTLRKLYRARKDYFKSIDRPIN